MPLSSFGAQPVNVKTPTNKIDLVDFDLHKDFYELLDSLGEVVELG
jgi:hypothetical protein